MSWTGGGEVKRRNNKRLEGSHARTKSLSKRDGVTVGRLSVNQNKTTSNYISRVRAPLKHQIGAHAFGRLTAPLVLNVDYYPELSRKQKKKRASQKPVAQIHRKKEETSKLNMADDYGKLLFFSFFPFEKHSIQAISCYSIICHLYVFATYVCSLPQS